ncbi:hypothetical protein M0805_003571 [Coniferiporia weirii]|nr:hypothetical protein M0805_003571 [Coniferiporia weirii]
MSAGSENQQVSQLALPSPSDAGDAQESKTAGSKEEANVLKFDELGPIVIKNDGTLSRITNWTDMTERERERTLRVLNARNK